MTPGIANAALLVREAFLKFCGNVGWETVDRGSNWIGGETPPGLEAGKVRIHCVHTEEPRRILSATDFECSGSLGPGSNTWEQSRQMC